MSGIFTNAEIDQLFRDNDTVHLTFVKTDGTVRNMRCTTNSNQIPTSDLPSSTDSQFSSVLSPTKRVYEIDPGQWRSFRYDSVLTARGIA